jgi:single-strand DNA-binding protein
MAGEPQITVIGSVGADAELKFLPSGAACCSWNLAYTPRTKQGDTWVNGETVWIRCTAWRELGESAAEQVLRGMRLIVLGRLKVRTYEHQGEKRTSVEMDVDEVGADMRYARVTARKTERSGGNETGGNRQPAYSGGPAEDPWGAGPNTPSESTEEPPF